MKYPHCCRMYLLLQPEHESIVVRWVHVALFLRFGSISPHQEAGQRLSTIMFIIKLFCDY